MERSSSLIDSVDSATGGAAFAVAIISTQISFRRVVITALAVAGQDLAAPQAWED